jgi:hypothetical protein
VVSGINAPSVTHNASITISGTGFGQKPTAAPLKWDTFEARANLPTRLQLVQPEAASLIAPEVTLRLGVTATSKSTAAASVSNRTDMPTYSTNFLSLFPPVRCFTYWHKAPLPSWWRQRHAQTPRIIHMANPGGGHYNLGDGDGAGLPSGYPDVSKCRVCRL